MALVELDLVAAFQQQFGITAPAFNPTFNPVIGDKASNRNNYGLASGTPYYANDTNGREVFMPVMLSYVGSDGQLTDFTLFYAAVGISGGKQIIDTPLTDRTDGGVASELINTGIYKVKVKGFFVDENDGNDYPEGDITTLRTLYEQNVPVTLKCAKTDIFLLRSQTGGNSTVTIRNFDLPDNVGIKHVQPYTMDLWSDVPFNLTEI